MRQDFYDFLEYLEFSKKRSTRTREIYSQILNDFEKYLSGDEPSEENARSFLRSRAQKISASTQSLHVSVLRSLGRWMRLENNASSTWLLKSPKVTQKKIRVFAEEDLGLLLETVESRPVDEQILFYLLYGSALRVSEALGLEWEHIDLIKSKIRVLGKGSKWREVPLAHGAVVLLRSKQRSPGLWHQGSIPYSTAREWVFQWGRDSGLNEKYDALHPHLLRHALASHLLRRGAKLPHIQKLLGHSQLSTTEKYTHLEVDDLIRAYDKAMGTKKDLES
ncbi:MAG: tyrosine-type recombinase/integrase [Bdellovibrionota bacterium]